LGAKLIADFDGKPLVRWAVNAAMASRANPIIAGKAVAVGNRQRLEAEPCGLIK